jgi:hypothetical protein
VPQLGWGLAVGRRAPIDAARFGRPAEIEGVDMDQFIGGELSFEDWLAESLNTGIYRKVDEEEWS